MATFAQTDSSITSEIDTTAPDTQIATPDTPDYFDGGDRVSCQWEDGACTEIADHYILGFCDDPDCRHDHSTKYCLRHYLIRLGLKLDHLKACPGMRDAATPGDVRQVALNHIAGFGALNCGQENEDGAVSPIVDDPLPSDTDSDVELADLQDHIHEFSYDELRMTPNTTAEQLQQWIDGLELCHGRYHIEYFPAIGENEMLSSPTQYNSLHMQEYRFDRDWEEPHLQLYDPDADRPWTPLTAVALERDNLVSPYLWSTQDDDLDGSPTDDTNTDNDDDGTGIDDGISECYSNDSLWLPLLRAEGMITPYPMHAAPNLFALVEERTRRVLPVTTGSFLQWRSDFDGDDNTLKVRDDATFRRSIAPYLAYYDMDKPLDEVKAKAKVADIERCLHRIIDHGVRPEQA